MIGTQEANTSDRLLPRWVPGERVDYRKLNQAVDRLNRLPAGVDPPVQGRPLVGVQFAHFRVQSEDEEYVTAWKILDDGAGNEWLDAEDVYLAKPPNLRPSEYEAEVHGTITWTKVSANQRQATDSATSDTEDQVNIPRLLTLVGDFKGKMVLAVKGIQGGTRVTKGIGAAAVKVLWEIVGPFAFAKEDATGVQSRLPVTITTDTTLTADHSLVLCDATAGAITITLPAAASNNGRRYQIKKIDSSGNTVTVVGTIDGEPNQVLASQNDCMPVESDGTQWWIC